jgi:hypothetical protein
MSPMREVRASRGENTIRVYQAFSNAIAEGALKAQTLVAPFSRSRMTWIKPSFCWMMYRSGWARKDNQERVLGIDITRAGFEWALSHSCATAFDPNRHSSVDEWKRLLSSSPVRIQWDPERTVLLEPLDYRTIQIGLSGVAVESYADTWITKIEDVTPLARQIELLAKNGEREQAQAQLPNEVPYSLSDDLSHWVGCDTSTTPT